MYLTKQKKEESLKEYSKTLCEGIQPEEQKQKRMKREKLKGYIGHHQAVQCIYDESSRRKRSRKLIRKNNGQKLPKFGEGNGHPDSRSQTDPS